jgi:hypothetical protein
MRSSVSVFTVSRVWVPWAILSTGSGFPDPAIYKNVISITDRYAEQPLRFSNDAL